MIKVVEVDSQLRRNQRSFTFTGYDLASDIDVAVVPEDANGVGHGVTRSF